MWFAPIYTNNITKLYSQCWIYTIFWREIWTTRASIQVQLGHGLCAYGFRPSAAVSKVYNNIIIYIISKFENGFQSFRNSTPICDEADFFNSYIIISYYTFDWITNTRVYRCTIYMYMFICNELYVCVKIAIGLLRVWCIIIL